MELRFTRIELVFYDAIFGGLGKNRTIYDIGLESENPSFLFFRLIFFSRQQILRSGFEANFRSQDCPTPSGWPVSFLMAHQHKLSHSRTQEFIKHSNTI